MSYEQQRWLPRVRGQQIGLGDDGKEWPNNPGATHVDLPGGGRTISRATNADNSTLAMFRARPRASIGYSTGSTDVNTVNWTRCGPIRPSIRMLTTRVWPEQGRNQGPGHQTEALHGSAAEIPGVLRTGKVYASGRPQMQGGRQNNLTRQTYRGQSYSETTVTLR